MPRSASSVYNAILPYADHHGNVSIGIATHGPMARHLGLLAMRMGDLERAETHLARAIAASAAMPSPPFLALACMASARVALWDGRSAARERAAALLGRALVAARQAGLWAIARSCRALADSVALRLPALSIVGGASPPSRRGPRDDGRRVRR